MVKRIFAFMVAITLMLSMNTISAYAIQDGDPCPKCGGETYAHEVHKDGTDLTSAELEDSSHGSYTDYADDKTCVSYYKIICWDCDYSSEVLTKVYSHEFVDPVAGYGGTYEVHIEKYNAKKHRCIVPYHCWLCGYEIDHIEYEDHYFQNGKCTSCGYVLVKKSNPLKIKAKTATVKYKKLKKKAQTLAISKVITFTKKGQGKMKYTISSVKKGSKNFKKYFKINAKTGKITIKKKLKKGTYKVKISVSAAGNSSYNSATRTVTSKIRIK